MIAAAAENNNVDQKLAARIIEGRHVSKMRVQYGRKLSKFKTWVGERYPECIDQTNETLRYTGKNSLKDDHYTEFFANVSKKPPAGPNSKRKRKGNFQSFGHVSGFRSAIVADMGPLVVRSTKRAHIIIICLLQVKRKLGFDF